MRCRGCQERLSEWVDGGLSVKQARAVEEHLAGCAVCRAVRDDLVVMCERFRALGVEEISGAERLLDRRVERETELDAGDAMWRGIEAGLDEDEARARREAKRLFRRIPALAPATAALLIAGGASAGILLKGQAATLAQGGRALDRELLRQAGTEMARAEDGYRGALDELCAKVQESGPSMPCLTGLGGSASGATAREKRPAWETRFESLRAAIATMEEQVIPSAVGPREAEGAAGANEVESMDDAPVNAVEVGR